MRQWRMLRAVPRYPARITADMLKKRLESAGFVATLRTIQRDLVRLSTVLPLQGDESRPQGWSWKANAQQMDLPTLEPQAALVFYLAERHLQSLLPASTLSYLSPWFRTAAGILDSQANGLSTWRNKVRVLPSGPPLLPPAIDEEVQSTITQALLLNKQVAVTYRPRNKKEYRTYEANPLGLVVRDQVIYLVCTLQDYQDVKQLVLSRMRSAKILENPAKALKGFDLDRYIAQGEFGMPLEPGRTITLVADFDRSVATWITERPLDFNQVVVNINETTLRLTATVLDTQEIRRWLLGFGADVEVIAPKQLREDIKVATDKLFRKYA